MESNESNRRSLKSIVGDLLFLEQQANAGEEIDIEHLQELEVELPEKVDACIYVESQLEGREEHLRSMKAAIEYEIKFTQKERKKIKDFIAHELDRFGVKRLMTRLHRVTIRLSDWKMTPAISKKVKNIEDLKDTDPRCIIEETTYQASRTLAKEILKKTGKIPIGFEASKSLSCLYKRSKTEDE